MSERRPSELHLAGTAALADSRQRRVVGTEFRPWVLRREARQIGLPLPRIA